MVITTLRFQELHDVPRKTTPASETVTATSRRSTTTVEPYPCHPSHRARGNGVLSGEEPNKLIEGWPGVRQESEYPRDVSQQLDDYRGTLDPVLRRRLPGRTRIHIG